MERNQTQRDAEHRMQAEEDRLRSLLLLGLTGDAKAYQECLHGMAAHLRAFFKRRLASLPSEVEDLVPLTAWVHAIARYKLVGLFRARAGVMH